jgi:hypothetical protein
MLVLFSRLLPAADSRTAGRSRSDGALSLPLFAPT